MTSRLNAFGFNTDPDVVANGADIITGTVLSDIEIGLGNKAPNLPNGVGRVEVCLTTQSCTGGGGPGLDRGESASGSFSLKFGDENEESLTLSNFAVRYQNLNVGSGSGTGQLVNAVPEPGTWALMLLGFGAIGFSMRRRRRVNALLQMA